MKKNITLLFIVIMLLGGCDDDFLEREPTKQVTDSNFFNSEAELELYSNRFYSYVPGLDVVESDFSTSDNVELNVYSAFLAGVRTVPASGGGWDWGTLRSINYFLENYRKADLPDEVLNYYEGLSKFFRAWFYFDKLQLFGDVPWYSTPLQTNSPELYKPRDPRILVTDSILSDLNTAIGFLDADRHPTKITKWTALALKSRFCLYEGTYRKYHKNLKLTDSANKFLNESVNASLKLMEESGYSIYDNGKITDYQDMFTKDEPNAEFILSRVYSKELSIVHAMNYMLLAPTMIGGSGMTKQMVESYLMEDGSFYSSIPESKRFLFSQECTGRDRRLSQTIRTPGYKRIGTTEVLLPDFKKAATGYQVTKFLSGINNDAYNESANAIPVFRYAEVLLNYAEAKAELGTLNQNDLNRTINLTRKRGGLPDLKIEDLKIDPSQQLLYPEVTSASILEVRRERRIELAFEGLRRMDLMRWRRGQLLEQRFTGIYFDKMSLQDLDGDGVDDFMIVKNEPAQPMAGITYLVLGDTKILSHGTYGYLLPQPFTIKTFNENRDYLYPIPLNELSINENLVQNPGWNF
ncbi:RagB/SusD family nutrient uptake outer membrane protein [Dysgonomonadaceae bacterium zrk40]|nr:RagB/SusD family nutrient uptake outer membrane protein [Dysgonomonadaceae bacterium zrk40]